MMAQQNVRHHPPKVLHRCPSGGPSRGPVGGQRSTHYPLSFAKNRSDRKPCYIRTLANEMNGFRGEFRLPPTAQVTYMSRIQPPWFSRTARYQYGNVGLSSRCIFGEPHLCRHNCLV